MDTITLLFLGLALLIVWKLRSVLGRRTGTERPPQMMRRGGTGPDENAGPMPPRGEQRPRDETAPGEMPGERLRGPGMDPAAAEGLAAITRADSSFDGDQFLSGAYMAYEMIVNSFATGDRAALKPLLSREVFDGFEGAIAEREAAGHTVQSSFIGIDSADITAASLRGRTAQVTVRFVSKIIQATRGADGAVIEGDPTRVTTVTDIWTFARELNSPDPNWRLVATEAE